MMIDSFYFSFLYKLAYAFTAVIVVFSSISIETKKDYFFQKKLGNFLILFPIIILIPLIGLRNFDVGTDTHNYYEILWLTDSEIKFDGEFLFFLIAEILKYFNLSYGYFLFLIASLFIFLMYSFVRKVSNSYHSNAFFIFFAYMSMFFFLSLGINVIRQGIALACLLVAYSYFINKESKLKLMLLILSSLAFHSSSLVPLLMFAVIVISKKITVFKDKQYYIIFFLFAVVSYLNFGLLDVAPTLIDFLGSDNRRVGYLSGDDLDYSTGFRLDFIIFNTVFLFISIYAKSLIMDIDLKDIYSTIVRYYIAASCLFFMAFQLPFSDRWGLFSWIVIPLIMSPLLYSTSVKNGVRIHWVAFLILIFIGFNVYG